MRSIIKLTGCLLAIIVLTAFQARATTVVYYSFTSNTTFAVSDPQWSNAVLTADIGSSLSQWSNLNGTVATQIVTGTTLNMQSGYTASSAVSANQWQGTSTNRWFQFTFNSTGYSNLVVSWAAQRSGGGPGTNLLLYSTDGFATYTVAANLLLPTASVFASFTNDLSGFSAVNDNANLAFRIVGMSGAAGGTLRVDNFTIEAIAIPEPSTVLLVGTGLVGLLALRRRRS